MKNISVLFFLSAIFFASVICVWSQEIGSASTSKLTGVSLPAGAQRVSEESLPAEVTQTLDKIVAEGKGAFRKGETEVLAWVGARYSKANSKTTVNRLIDSLKAAGWKYSVEGEEGGLTLFSVVKDGAARRAIVGFYGATDEALIFTWMEILASGSSPTAGTDDSPRKNIDNSENIFGTWTNGSMSTLGDKNLTTGAVTPSNGSTYKYVFHPDGRFEFIGLIQSTTYGCTTSLFNDKRGKYEISGSQITFIPSKNFWRNTYSCSPSNNKERDYVLDRETVSFRTKTDEYGRTLICLANEKGESCYRKAD